MTPEPDPGTALPARLLGERVLLRPFEEDDVAAARTVYCDDEVMRYVGEGGAVTPEVAARMVHDYRRHQREHGFGFWAVIDKRTGRLIGDAGLEVTEHGTELGYTLARRWWGQGLATEAARLWVDAAFRTLGLQELVALVDARNPASSRVLEKLGFGLDEDRPGAVEPSGAVTAYGRPHLRYRLSRAHHGPGGTRA